MERDASNYDLAGECWWARRQEIELGSYTKYQVEDFTGCTLLFLDKCVVNGRIDLVVKLFAEIASQAMAFERELQARCSRSELRWYGTTHSTI